MTPPLLRADCARCVALCCVSLAFDRSELFAFDKAAGVPCPHVTQAHRCRIHGRLEDRGFAGCARYDCLGAGQRVSQELYPGRSWREHPALARSMFDAFRALRQVHELLLLLHTAGRLPLTREQEGRRGELLDVLQPSLGWSPQALAAFEQGSVAAEVRAFLRTLRAAAAREVPARRQLPVVP